MLTALRKFLALCTATLVMMLASSALLAHHSSRMFAVTEAEWVTGTVTRYEPVNPHARIELEQHTEAGETVHWIVEGPRPGRIDMLGTPDGFLQAGDVITVCGFHPADRVLREREGSDSIMARPNFVHGRLMMLGNGEQWLWGPYGQLEACLPTDAWDSIRHGEVALPAPH